MKPIAVIAGIAAAAFGVSGCGSDTTTPPTATPPTATVAGVGDSTTFTYQGNLVGTFRVTDVVAVPAECAVEPGPVIAFRAEISNAGQLKLPAPDTYGVKVIDAGGITQNVDSATIRPACKSQYPTISGSQAPGKTAGWTAVTTTQPNPTALLYTPVVTEAGGTVENLKFVQVSPAFATVKLPLPLPAISVSAAVTPTATPAMTTAPSAPVVGQSCDLGTDRWATDPTGRQLRCTLAGGPAAKWVSSVPFIGTRTPGTPCDPDAGVAETSSGVTLMCVGDPGTWTPGP